MLPLRNEVLQKRVYGLPIAAWILLGGEFLIGLTLVLLLYLIVSMSRS